MKTLMYVILTMVVILSIAPNDCDKGDYSEGDFTLHSRGDYEEYKWHTKSFRLRYECFTLPHQVGHNTQCLCRGDGVFVTECRVLPRNWIKGDIKE